MDWNAILTAVIKGALSLAAACAGAFLTAWLETLRRKTEGQKNAAAADALVSKAQDAVTTAVDYVRQTLVEGVKGTEAWTAEAMAGAYEEAREKTRQVLGENAMEQLDALYGSGETWLQTKIEQAVLKSKGGNAA